MRCRKQGPNSYFVGVVLGQKGRNHREKIVAYNREECIRIKWQNRLE